MAIVGESTLRRPLVHDQLHIPHATVEVRVEVSRERRIRNLILLLLSLVLPVPHENRMTEDPLLREELLDELVPVVQVILALGTLEVK